MIRLDVPLQQVSDNMVMSVQVLCTINLETLKDMLLLKGHEFTSTYLGKELIALLRDKDGFIFGDIDRFFEDTVNNVRDEINQADYKT